MRSIEVQDLQERAADLLNDVQERKLPYVVTSGDEPVALLSPLVHGAEETAGSKTTPYDDDWDGYRQLAEKVREKWSADRESVQVLSEVRR